MRRLLRLTLAFGALCAWAPAGAQAIPIAVTPFKVYANTPIRVSFVAPHALPLHWHYEVEFNRDTANPDCVTDERIKYFLRTARGHHLVFILRPRAFSAGRLLTQWCLGVGWRSVSEIYNG